MNCKSSDDKYRVPHDDVIKWNGVCVCVCVWGGGGGGGGGGGAPSKSPSIW